MVQKASLAYHGLLLGEQVAALVVGLATSSQVGPPSLAKMGTYNDLNHRTQAQSLDEYLRYFGVNRSHARGKKKRHPWEAYLEEPPELPRCHECYRRVGDKRCGDCDADLCDSCQAFGHSAVSLDVLKMRPACSNTIYLVF